MLSLIGDFTMAEVSNAARFSLGERVRLISPPGKGLYARILEVMGPFGSSGHYRYGVSFEEATVKTIDAILSEEYLEKAPPRRGR